MDFQDFFPRILHDLSINFLNVCKEKDFLWCVFV